MLIDTHGHIQLDTYDNNRDEIVRRALDAGVEYIVCPGIDPESNEKAIRIAEEYENVFAAVGVHPHDAEALPENWLAQIEELSKHPKVVALGEMGLDYFKDYSPRDVQRRAFIEQLELAGSLELPVIVHNRDSDDDMVEIMTEYGPGNGVMHCFTSDLQMAETMVGLGYVISFSGIATFGNTTVEEAVRGLDIQHLMVETDCPFLAPAPKRGKTNEPSFVRYTAEKVAALKGLSISEVEEMTTRNAVDLFRLPV